MIKLIYDIYELSYNYKKINHQPPTHVILTAAQWNQFIKDYKSIGVDRIEKKILGLKVGIGNKTYVYRE